MEVIVDETGVEEVLAAVDELELLADSPPLKCTITSATVSVCPYGPVMVKSKVTSVTVSTYTILIG